MNREDLVEIYFTGTTALNKAWRKNMFIHFANSDLSPTQITLLFMLEHKQPISGKDLAKSLQVSASAITQLLDGLSKYIDREHDPDDRRIIHIRLSKAGQKQMREMHKHRKQMFIEATTSLSDHEINTMIAIQKKMLEQIERQ